MSGFATPDTPNLADFLTFLSDTVQIPAAALPVGSPWPGYALNQAIAVAIDPPSLAPPVMYSLACYNGATHVLIAITPDQPGQTYFTDARGESGFAVAEPMSGLVVSSSGPSASTSLAQPAWAAGLTVGQLELFRTPWGRKLLAWNQSYGPTIWGLS